MTRRLGHLAALLLVLACASAVPAEDLRRNPSGLPSLVKSTGAWTAGHCLIVDVGGNTATFASCGGGSGDITDVWSTTSGNVNALTAASGDTLDAGSADSSKPCKRGTALPGTCAEGDCFQDTDAGGIELYVCTATNTWTKALTGVDVDTSAELLALVTDETGTGALVFGTSPTLVTPTIASFTNATHDHTTSAGGGQLSITGATTGTVTVPRGGTNATSFTANRCIRSNSAGTALEVAAGDCSTAGIVTLTSDTGSATGTTVTMAGGLGIDTSAVGSTFSIDLDLTELGNATLFDGANATRTLTAAVTGTDPVLSFSASQVAVSTGALLVSGGGLTVSGGNASVSTHNLTVDAGQLGVGTTAIPHGAVGWAKLALEGANNASGGPHMQFTTATDDRPVLGIYPLAHTEQGIGFDAYYDGVWKSSSSTANYALINSGGVFSLVHEAGIAGGSAIAWDEVLTIGADISVNLEQRDIDTFIFGNASNAAFKVDAGLNQVFVGKEGIDFVESDTNPPCAAGQYEIYADLSETKLKKCQNGTVTDLGAGTGSGVTAITADSGGSTTGSTITLTGGSGGITTSRSGDVVTFAVSVNTLEIDDGTITHLDIDDTDTLAGNPTNGNSSCWFATTGFICEGTVSDNNEGLLIWPTIGADRTLTLPDETGTVCTTGSLCSGYGDVTLTGTQTLTNKTLTSPTITNGGGFCVGTSAEGQMCWDGTANVMVVGDGAAPTYFAIGNASGESTAAATNSVTLTTDTTGSYAAGDAEAGNATGVACTDCVALTTETTGNYVATITAGNGITGSSSTEGGTPTLAVDESDGFAWTGAHTWERTSTATSAGFYATSASTTLSPSGSSTLSGEGVFGYLSTTGSQNQTDATLGQAGVYGRFYSNGSGGTIARGIGVRGIANKGSAQSVTDLIGVYGQVKNYNASGTATLGAAFYAAAPDVAGGAITNKWAYYSEDTTPSSLGGNLTLRGSSSGSVTLDAGGSPATQIYTLPVSYPGTSGEALKSTTGGSMSWGPAVDTTAAYNWTNAHTWARTSTATSSTVFGLQNTLTANPASGSASFLAGYNSAVTSGGAATVSALYGSYGEAVCNTSNGCTTLRGGWFEAYKAGTGTVAAADALTLKAGNAHATNNVTVSRALHILVPYTTGAIGTSWAIYTDGPEDSSLAGGLEIRTDSEKLKLGTGLAAELYYDGTNLVIDPDVVGTGSASVAGKLAAAYTTTDTSATISALTATLTTDQASGVVSRYGASLTGTTSSGASSTFVLGGALITGDSVSNNGATVLYGANVMAIKSGTGTVAGAVALSAQVKNTGASGSMTAGTALAIENGVATSAIGTQVGIDLKALAAGTINIGFRNASTDVEKPQTVTVADNANGGTPATSTLTVSAAFVRITCNDPQSCDITMSETGAQDGQRVEITCINNNGAGSTCDFADSAGVLETTGTISIDSRDTLILRYSVDHWQMVHSLAVA